jgi:phosphoserine phosphatase
MFLLFRLVKKDYQGTVVIKQLIEAHGYSPICMVGDGVTDMQAKPPADLFIGFGGVVVRDNVQKGADWFVRDFQQVIDVLETRASEAKQ